MLLISIITLATIHWASATHWTNLKFSKGDILGCKMNSFANHILLALSDWEIAHMAGRKSEGLGKLAMGPWETFHKSEGDYMSDCWIEQKADSNAEKAVIQAKRDVLGFNGRDLYYDLFACNCEHWVYRWAADWAYSYQSRRTASTTCDANYYPRSIPFSSKYVVTRRTTNGYRCDSDCTRFYSGDSRYYCSVDGYSSKQHCSPEKGRTYKGEKCGGGSCDPYLDYYYCYTDSKKNWDYCGPDIDS